MVGMGATTTVTPEEHVPDEEQVLDDMHLSLMRCTNAMLWGDVDTEEPRY